jgi:WD40 repeat protein
MSGHSGEVRDVAWAKEDQRIATTGADGTARVWDAATGEELLVLVGLSGDLRNVAWSPCCDRLVAGGGTILPV